MKKILLVICCVISVVSYAQQTPKAHVFHVVSFDTKQAIGYASVNILKAKLAIATEQDGVFIIPGNLAEMRDTIVINAQIYIPLKLPISKLATMDTIRLSKVVVNKREIQTKFSAKKILNEYLADDIGLYAGVPTEDAPFNYLQIAQHFVTDAAGNKLASITINKPSDWLMTKFRVRIYDADPKTDAPGTDICDRIIDIDNEDFVKDYLNRRSKYTGYLDSKSTTVDLRKDNIIIPGKSFFVAVEWLRDFFNATKAPLYNKVTGKVDTAIVFRPYVGISPVKGNKLNIWVMDLDRQWKTYDHFYPFGTDLAIKATVQY